MEEQLQGIFNAYQGAYIIGTSAFIALLAYCALFPEKQKTETRVKQLKESSLNNLYKQ